MLLFAVFKVKVTFKIQQIKVRFNRYPIDIA